MLFPSSVASQPPEPETDDRRRTRGAASMLAAAAGVLAAFGCSVVLTVVGGAAWFSVVGMPLDLAPRDWHRLATAMALGAALMSLLAYLFGGYVAARLGGRDGLQHGLRVFALGVLALGLLGLLMLAMAGPVGVGTGLRQPGMPPRTGQGIAFGDVATKAAIWSMIAMLLGSTAGGLLGGRAHRRRAEAARHSAGQEPSGAERPGAQN